MISALAMTSALGRLQNSDMASYRSSQAMFGNLRKASLMGQMMANMANMANPSAFMNSNAFLRFAGQSQAMETDMMMNRLMYKPLAQAQYENAQKDFQMRLKMLYA